MFVLLVSVVLKANDPFRFALFTDLHISATNPQAATDLSMAVAEVNLLSNIDFVVISGDITEMGDKESLLVAKLLLGQLKIPYYIVAGNHELKWSESGATDFAKVFGDDKFSFLYKGIRFVGFSTGPVIKMGDGHIAPQDIQWVKGELAKTGPDIPIFVVTHYPLLPNDVDNWYEMTDVLRKFNVQTLLGGHYHRNVLFNYDGISGVINRSTLRAKEGVGGYSIYEVSDSIRVFEKKIAVDERQWLSIPFEKRVYPEPNLAIRPSFEVNKSNRNVNVRWQINSGVGLYGTPAVDNKRVFYGDDFGVMHAVSLKNGMSVWTYKTANRIVSSPAVSNGRVVFGSTDGGIYCLDAATGKLHWKYETSKAVLGSPTVHNDTVYVGGSDGCFRALDLLKGTLIWSFCQLSSYVETRAVVANSKVYFGAWDSNFYALNTSDGSLAWKWNNGNARSHFSPAAVLPVISNHKVFITAPDRYWTALNAHTGQVVWRTNQHQVRETVGVSESGNMVFSRCMNDSVVALDALADSPKVLWKTNAAYGYDHNPSMLVERNGIIVFGTKNGLLHGVHAKTGRVLWRYKIGNSIINTVNIISKNECLLTTSEGVVARIRF